MAATTKPAAAAPPPRRLPERQHLAEAIEAHAEAVAQHERVEEARKRLDDDLFGRLQPARREAERDLAEARAREPRRLVAATLGEAADDPTAAQAEAALADLDRQLSEARQARSLLDDEATRAEIAVAEARRRLDAAVAAAVSADPARHAAVAEFFRAGRRALRCAQILRTAGLIVRGVEAHGLRFVVTDAVVPLGQRAFFDDPEWAAALAALREDPDAPLPGLPEPEPAEPEPAAPPVAA